MTEVTKKDPSLAERIKNIKDEIKKLAKDEINKMTHNTDRATTLEQLNIFMNTTDTLLTFIRDHGEEVLPKKLESDVEKLEKILEETKARLLSKEE